MNIRYCIKLIERSEEERDPGLVQDALEVLSTIAERSTPLVQAEIREIIDELTLGGYDLPSILARLNIVDDY